MTYHNPRFLQALHCQPTDQIPIWLMRQAGRYLPEYLKTRAQAGDFMTLCKTPELACEVTLQPIRRFGFDAAIIFSDILTIPDAMGMKVSFKESHGPQLERVIQNIKDIQQLSIPDPHQELNYVMDAIKLVCHELDQQIPLIGFAGSPWTLATYMLEGSSSRDFKKSKTFMYNQPTALHQLLDLLSQSIAQYLIAQIKAGVATVMIFDTWGGILSHTCYQTFSLTYLQKIIDLLKQDPASKNTPIILFTKHGGIWLPQIMATGCDAIGIDWTMDLKTALTMANKKVAIQGNLDPMVLYASETCIRREVEQLLHSLPHQVGYIFNLGHGILPDIPIAHVETMIETVRVFKR